MSVHDTLTALATQFSNIDFRDRHFAPTRWEQNAPSSMLPFPKHYEWSSLARALNQKAGAPVMCIAPLVWQLEPLVHTHTHAHGHPIISVPAESAAVANAYFQQLPVHTLITTPDIFAELHTQIQSAPKSLEQVILIHHSPASLQPHKIDAVQIIDELHLAPGLWLATRAGADLPFSLNHDIAWQHGESHTQIAIELPDGSRSDWIELDYGFEQLHTDNYRIRI